RVAAQQRSRRPESSGLSPRCRSSRGTPAAIALLRPDVIDLDTGRMAMISAPEKLAAVLNAIHG
ncbi:hypothetical protein ABT169_35650, partial [Streptomyces sp. NPDC001616]|uniref:hypothetical protein n=1 Tax=Streptomyces sp. NPDC001616 TaxID=3156648 RepID=UPI00331FE38F